MASEILCTSSVNSPEHVERCITAKVAIRARRTVNDVGGGIQKRAGSACKGNNNQNKVLGGGVHVIKRDVSTHPALQAVEWAGANHAARAKTEKTSFI